MYPLPDYTNLGERFCAAVSILYGKRFDNHGFLISHGMYSVPDLSDRRPTTYWFQPLE